MKQEHRFVAELYRYLAPFVDSSRRVFVCLDGEAARTGHEVGDLEDDHVPDLCLTLVGCNKELLLEAKILNPDGTVTLSRGQLAAWRMDGTGKLKPHGWVAAREDLKEFTYWSHEAFLPILDECRSGSPYPRIKVPNCPSRLFFEDIRELALHIIRSLTQGEP